MKKILFLFISIMMFAGCLAYQFGGGARGAETADYVLLEKTPSVTMREEADAITVEKVEASPRQAQAVSHEAVKLTDQVRVLLKEKQTDSYAYQHLTQPEQEIYIEILWALTEFQENVVLSSMDQDEIARIFQCVLNDHPEIFYVDGYTYTQYTLGDILKKITFTGTYQMEGPEIDQKRQQIETYVNQCLEGLPENADEYETVKYIYEYLIFHTEYDAESENNQNICSVFLNGSSVCQGYAKATQYLLQKAGIYATLVLGRVSAGEGHAWNLVRIDGSWYYVDTTWGDASYQAVGATADFPEKKMPSINYDYLCVTTKQLCKTHEIDNVVELPQCASMEANYYVREGLYFTSLDKEQLAGIFADGYERGNAYVTLKCASAEIYGQMQEMLITNQEIFHYLDSEDGVVSYTDSEEQYSMSFWL